MTIKLYLRKLKLWDQNLGVLIKHLIKRSLELVKNKDFHKNDKNQISELVDSFDKRILGLEFWKFQEKVEKLIWRFLC
ncbi:MAG: hypothetical protein CR982_03530 [Candidatus Cloacimonadota bacterium]|nr:MAG: hypothetical protein CR982_03530 [Candidatus Cloacimonadota bacterium]PIE78317.1 MAG: hypothetical protein CSA15_08475 [Candidatus Delongbacteria bacterium]